MTDTAIPLVAAWLLSAGSPHTVRAYRSDLAQYAVWLAGHDTDLQAATRHHLDTYAHELAALAAPATVARKLAAISSCYGYAVAEGRRETNPAARAWRPDVDPDYSPTQGLDAADAVDAVTAGRARGPVIATSSGKPMATSEIYRTVRRLASKAGIAKHITPRSLWHPYATLALDSGVPLADVQTDMGHRDPRTTRRYDRTRQNLDRSGAYRVAAAIYGLGDG